MCLSIKHERAAEAVIACTHDVVLPDRAKRTRFAPCGRKIKPMEASVAADAIGMSEKETRNLIDPNQRDRELKLRQWVLMLMDGMDTLPLEELCRRLDGLFFRNPDVDIDEADPEKSLSLIMKEMGDVGHVAMKNCDESSPAGKKWNQREREAFDREIDDWLIAILKYKKVAHAVHDAQSRR